MTKAEVVQKISERTGLNKRDVQRIIESFAEEVKESLINDEPVYIRGFGTFLNIRRAQKIGRNISKGLPMVIPETIIPKFKPSYNFKKMITKDSYQKK